MPRQHLGSLRADVPDAQSEQQRGERLALGGGNAVDELLRRLLGETLQREQLHRGELVQVADVRDQLGVEQRPHALVAEPPDVHGAATREVHDAFENPRGAGNVGAIGHHLVVRMLDLGAAAGAALRHAKRLLAPRAPGRRTQNLRNHFARARDFDRVADTDVLGGDEICVVQRGVRDGDPADFHRFEDGVGVERTGAAHVDTNVEQLRHLDFGGELPGD